MKKKTLLLAAIFGASASFAQVTSLKSKKGFEVLPEAGDYAIQFDATPLLDFGLNAIKIGANGTQTAGNTITAPNGLNTVFVGKYFADASTAYRVKVGINTNLTKTTLTVGSLADSEVTLEQAFTSKYNHIQIGGGIEKRRGHNRLQGFYGGEALLSLGSTTVLNGVEISEDLNVAFNDYGAAYGTSSQDKGSAIGFVLRGFVGAEYFVLPKISLGGELGWGLSYSRGKTETTTKVSDGTTITETTVQNPAQKIFGFTNAPSMNMVATFHF